MTIPTLRTRPTTLARRLGLATAGLAALGGVTLSAFGPADAAEPAFEVPCDVREWLGNPCDDDSDDGPSVTLPPGVNISIPDGPIVTLPPGVHVTIPDDDPPAEQPTEQPTDPPAEQPTEQPTEQPGDAPSGTSPPPPGGSSQQPETPGQTGLLLPAVRISQATVACDGSVTVAYETGADPALSAEAEHVLSVSPLTVPDLAMSRRIIRQPLTGQFTAEIAAPVDDYRVFVLVDFEPGNPDGVLLADEATATAPTDCPTG